MKKGILVALVAFATGVSGAIATNLGGDWIGIAVTITAVLVAARIFESLHRRW